MTEGTVIEWRKSVGDSVDEGETLLEVTTDKVDVEIPAPAAGVLTAIAADAGTVVEVGQLLGEMASGVGASAPAEVTPAAPTAPVPAAAASAVATPPPLRDVAASPIARRVAFEKGVDLGGVTGTGPGGLIRRGDVENAGKAGGPADPAPPAGEELVRLTGPAAALADYMDESRSIPTATTFRTISVQMLDAERKRLNEALSVAGGGKLSFTHIIAWAIIRAVGLTPGMATAFARV